MNFRSISPKGFKLAAAICSGIWFLALYPALLVFAPQALSDRLAPQKFPDLPVDTPQWYLGAAAARNGEWRNLYPELNPNIYNAPNNFRPLLETPLFDPAAAAENGAFYPIFSVRTPLFLSRFYPVEQPSRYPAEFWVRQHPWIRNSAFHYFYPPPTALAMAPLAWMELESMGLHWWPILASVALFGTSLMAALVYRRLAGKETYAEGALIFAVLLLAPWADELHCGNVSPMLSFFLAWALAAWLGKRQCQTGCAIIAPLLTKGLTVSWTPFLLLGRKIQWGTIATLAVWTVALNAAVFAAAGWSDALFVYRRFFFEIMPKLTPVVGYDYMTRIAENYGFYPAALYIVLQILLFGAIYYGYFRRCRRTDDPSILAAALAGTICIFLIFSRLHWNHYFPYLFYFPFLGYLAFEAMRREGSARFAARAALALGIPAMFTTQLDTSATLIAVEQFLAAPLAALNSDIVVWKYLLPRLRTLAIMAGLLTALLKLYPAAIRTPSKRTCKITGAALAGIIGIYFGAALALRVAAGCAPDPASAARMGYVPAMREQARRIGATDPAESARYFRNAALLGDAESAYELARYFEAGHGVNRDPGSARRWYLQAGSLGKGEAWGEMIRIFPAFTAGTEGEK